MKKKHVKMEDIYLLGELLLEQKYALELVGCAIEDAEKNNGQIDRIRLKSLEQLYDRLIQAGY